MNREAIRASLNQLDWKSFRAAVSRVMEVNPNSTSVMAGMYSQIRLGKIFPSKVEHLIYLLVCVITPFWLILRKLFVAPWAYPKRARELGLSCSGDFDGQQKTADILVMLTAIFPSLYESPRRILAQLEKMNARTAALLFPAVAKAKKADILSMEKTCRISLYEELCRLSVGEIWSSAWRARGQYRQAQSLVQEEYLRAVFHANRRLLRLLFMFDNLYEAAYRRLFSRMKPKIIVDNWFNGALRKVTREMGIYTVMIQHGTQWGEDKEGVTPDEDELLIWGEFWRENFRKSVLSSTKIVSVGCPRFDPLIAYRGKPRDNRFYEGMKLDAGKQTVTFLSQSHGFVFPEKTKQIYLAIVAGLAALVSARKDQLNFIIKLHPHDNAAYYDGLLNEEVRKHVRFLRGEVPLYDLFRHTDIAISVTSTALLEAIAMDITAIQFECNELPDWIDFCTAGGGFLVRSGDELIQTIDTHCLQADMQEKTRLRRQAFLDHCLTNLGQSTEQSAEHLLAVLDRLKAP